MGKYVNGTFVPDEQDLLLQQQQKMAGMASAVQPQQPNTQIPAQNAAKAAAFEQAANRPAPVTPTNPDVQAFANGKQDYQPDNSPRVAGQAGTVYNIFTRPVAEQRPVQQAAKPVLAPTVTTPVNNGTKAPQNQPIRSMDDLAAAMGYTSPEQEEKLRKASVANQRIVAVADALRQIGNIYNTTRYAPSQQFNSPVELERQRYLQGKALRDKANQTYITYQQAKAAQDAKERQWEAEYGIKAANAADLAAYRKRQGDIAAGNAASQAAYREGNLARQKQRDADQKAHNEAALKQRTAYQNRMAGIAGMNAQTNRRRADAYINKLKSSGGGGASGIAPLDTPKGQITPNGRSYSNQLLQMFDYAKSRGLVQESDVAKRLREMGFGKDQSDNVKRQMVMDLLRTNSSMGDYAADRLGWTYGASNVADNMDLGLEDDEDEMDLGLE